MLELQFSLVQRHSFQLQLSTLLPRPTAMQPNAEDIAYAKSMLAANTLTLFQISAHSYRFTRWQHRAD